jgi:hypothetical protein
VEGGVSRRLLVPLAAAALAAALAALASGAFAVDRELATGERSGGVAADAAARITGADRERDLREAVRLVRARGGTLAQQLRRRQRAERLLAGRAAGGDARAANLLGVLALEDAAVDPSQARQAQTEAQAWFVAAIRTDPSNEDAKVNLELLLEQRAKQAREQARDGGREPKRGRGGSRGKGSGY